MYLLTWAWVRRGIHRNECAALFPSIDGAEREYKRIQTSDDRHLDQPELFERRGNDWIRIRPEGER